MSAFGSPSTPDSSRAFDDQIAWTATSEPSATDVVEKERLIKEILSLQSGLAALQQRVSSVQQDCTKAEAENETLQAYLDSITKNLAAKS